MMNMNMMGALSPQKQNMPSGANNGITEGALQNALATYQTPSDEFRSGVQGFLDNRQQAQAQVQPAAMGTSAMVDSNLAATYATMAAAPDPLNNAVTPKQQNALGAINANKFTRDHIAMQNLV